VNDSPMVPPLNPDTRPDPATPHDPDTGSVDLSSPQPTPMLRPAPPNTGAAHVMLPPATPASAPAQPQGQ